MDKIVSNQYIVTRSLKDQWHFFYMPNTGICYKRGSEKTWDDYEILLKEGYDDFDITIDSKGHLHLICQDKIGSIIYLMYNGQQWHKYGILKSKTNRAYPKHFKILCINNWVTLFYILDYKNQSLLIHHILDNSNIQPNVLDYINKTDRPFSISVDDSNNIHLCYQSALGANKLGHRSYLWSKKIWGEFTPIEKEEKDISHPYTLIDEQDTIHLVYLKKSNRSYDIMYTNKNLNNFNKTNWIKGITVSTRNFEDSLPILLKSGKKLWILWKQDMKIHISSSDNNGATWVKEAPFVVGRTGNLSLFGHRLSPTLDKGNIICNLCYGYTTNTDIHLYIVSDFIDKLEDDAVEPEYKVKGHEIEEFARKNSEAFKSSFSNPSSISQDTSPFFESSETSSDDPFFRSAENISDEEFFRSAQNISDISSFRKSSSDDSQISIDEDKDVESTKTKIMLTMLQQELSETKQKLLKVNQVSKMSEELKLELDTKYAEQIEKLKSDFQDLLNRIIAVQERQDQIIYSDMDRIEKEISILKRKNSRVSFEDLIKKADNKKTASSQ